MNVGEMNGNLSKSQKKAFKAMPEGWHLEKDLVSKGIDRSSLLALQSKGCLDFKMGPDGKSLCKRTQ
jgi:hypothetical protein